MSLTSIICVMMELKHCATGRALAVIANTTIVTPGYERLPRASAWAQISPQAFLLPKYRSAMNPRQRHSPPDTSLRTSLWAVWEQQMYSPPGSRMGVDVVVWLVKSPATLRAEGLEESHSPQTSAPERRGADILQLGCLFSFHASNFNVLLCNS